MEWFEHHRLLHPLIILIAGGISFLIRFATLRFHIHRMPWQETLLHIGIGIFVFVMVELYIASQNYLKAAKEYQEVTPAFRDYLVGDTRRTLELLTENRFTATNLKHLEEILKDLRGKEGRYWANLQIMRSMSLSDLLHDSSQETLNTWTIIREREEIGGQKKRLREALAKDFGNLMDVVEYCFYVVYVGDFNLWYINNQDALKYYELNYKYNRELIYLNEKKNPLTVNDEVQLKPGIHRLFIWPASEIPKLEQHDVDLFLANIEENLRKKRPVPGEEDGELSQKYKFLTMLLTVGIQESLGIDCGIYYANSLEDKDLEDLDLSMASPPWRLIGTGFLDNLITEYTAIDPNTGNFKFVFKKDKYTVYLMAKSLNELLEENKYFTALAVLPDKEIEEIYTNPRFEELVKNITDKIVFR